MVNNVLKKIQNALEWSNIVQHGTIFSKMVLLCQKLYKIVQKAPKCSKLVNFFPKSVQNVPNWSTLIFKNIKITAVGETAAGATAVLNDYKYQDYHHSLDDPCYVPRGRISY